MGMPGGGMMGGGMPGRAGGGLGGMPMPGMGGLGGARFRDDPEMYELVVADEKLERDSHGVAQHYTRVPKEEREALRQEVVRLVEEHFKVRQQRRMLELKRLEQQLQHLRQALERRAETRQKLIDRRVSELLGPEDPEVTF